jgi:hypothetical protein
MLELQEVTILEIWARWTQSPVTLLTMTGILVAAVLSKHAFFPRHHGTLVGDLGSISIFDAYHFFEKRSDFMRSHFQKTNGKPFSFRLLQVQSLMTYCCSCNVTSNGFSIQLQL